jgi:superfamily II DNA or RNA helicase
VLLGCAVISPARPYQTVAVTSVRAHWAAGRRRVCVALPTGSGKTHVAAMLLHGARNPLAIVHTRTLLDQTRRRMPGVTVLTVQAATRMPAGALAAHDVVFEDECHHLPSGRWATLRARYSPWALVLGCTATPQRADGVALSGLYDAIVAPVGYQQLLADGHLAPCDVIDAREYRGRPALAYLRHGRGLPGILFAPTMAACRDAVQTLRDAGVRAAPLDSQCTASVRTATLAAYAAGQMDVLCSPMALAEGFDSPRAQVCILDRECEHVGTYLQIANRVTRPDPACPGKRAMLLDCTGAAQRHGHPLQDRTYSLDGAGITTPPRQQSTVRAIAPRRAATPRWDQAVTAAVTWGERLLQRVLGW